MRRIAIGAIIVQLAVNVWPFVALFASVLPFMR